MNDAITKTTENQIEANRQLNPDRCHYHVRDGVQSTVARCMGTLNANHQTLDRCTCPKYLDQVVTRTGKSRKGR